MRIVAKLQSMALGQTTDGAPMHGFLSLSNGGNRKEAQSTWSPFQFRRSLMSSLILPHAFEYAQKNLGANLVGGIELQEFLDG